MDKDSSAIWKSAVQLGRSFIHFIYPPFCLHCNDSLTEANSLFCSSCSQLFDLLDPKERCPLCFSEEFNHQRQGCCASCRRKPRSLEGMAAAFEYEGPAATLIKRLKYGGLSYLSKGAAAFLVAQFVQLEWPFPDYVMPVPMDFLKRMDRGYNQSALLAESFAKMTGSTFSTALKRSKGSFSQAGLSYSQRTKMEPEIFCVPQTDLFHDKCILLVDDVMTTGSTLRCCAEVLHQLHPKSVYALTVCC